MVLGSTPAKLGSLESTSRDGLHANKEKKMSKEHYNFGEKIPDGDAEANAFADLVIEVIAAKKALRKAISKVPDYTAQWSDEDYYLNEQHRFNVAAKKLYDAVFKR